jgi:hypothetical protein
MSETDNFFHWDKVTGEPIKVDGTTVTPESQALTLRWPGRLGGFVWNHPTAVLVERGEAVERVPIVDLTRWAQVGVMGLGIILAMVILIQSALAHKEN